MVSKNNFQQNQTMQMQQQRFNNVRASIAPYRKPFRPQAPVANNQLMYSSCQMPSDPLYIDFNKPTPLPKVTQQNSNATENARDGAQSKKKQVKGKSQKGKQQTYDTQFAGANMNFGGDKPWQNNQRFHPNNRFMGNSNGICMQRNAVAYNRVQMGRPPNRARPMLPPMGPRGAGGVHMPPYPPMPFQPPMPPMRCPMPPPMGGPMPPRPPFMRRNSRGPPNHQLPPIMPPHMLGPRLPPRVMPPCGPFNLGPGGNVMHMNGAINGGKIKKPNPKLVKQAVKGKSTIKTLKNLVNQYPIDKPWVTQEIQAEHEKKTDIENRLKGHKDDELFAQFKLQRDKFVSMYETAREDYLKQEAASVMAKDAKDKNANSNQNAKVGNAKDATKPNPKSIKTELNVNAMQQQQNKAEK